MRNYKSYLGLSPTQRDLMALLSQEGGLPMIRGTWYFVDPTSGSNNNSGQSIDKPVADIRAAYNLCTSGAGDGICVLSRGTGTASQTTSYLKYPLAWSKHGITVFGVSSGTRLFGRARISQTSVSTADLTTCAQGDGFITREAGSFVTDGWVAGMTGKIADSGSNNGSTFTVTAVSALQLTISETLNAQAKAATVSTTLTNYVVNLLDVSGHNNLFINIHAFNSNADVLSVGCLKVSGHRNHFVNSHFVGAGHATPGASTGAYDLELNGGQENTFSGCAFGTDTVIRAAANGNIRFDTNAWRNRFYDCEVLSYSDTAGKGAILSADATALEGVQVFVGCRFINWNANGIGAATSAFIGTKPTSGALLMDGCVLVGWAAWDSVGGNDMVYVANSDATASGGGGIATTV